MPLGYTALRVHCDPWGDPKTLTGSSVALLGETQDPPGSPGALLGETPRPSGFVSCSTWGDPKTLRVRQLLYLGRPQDRTDSPHAEYAHAEYAHAEYAHAEYAHWLTVRPYGLQPDMILWALLLLVSGILSPLHHLSRSKLDRTRAIRLVQFDSPGCYWVIPSNSQRRTPF